MIIFTYTRIDIGWIDSLQGKAYYERIFFWLEVGRV